MWGADFRMQECEEQTRLIAALLESDVGAEDGVVEYLGIIVAASVPFERGR